MLILEKFSIKELEAALAKKRREPNKEQIALNKARQADLDKVQKFIEGWGWNIAEDGLQIPDVKVKCGKETLTFQVEPFNISSLDSITFTLTDCTRNTLIGEILSDMLLDCTDEMQDYIPPSMERGVKSKCDKLYKFLGALPNGQWIASQIFNR